LKVPKKRKPRQLLPEQTGSAVEEALDFSIQQIYTDIEELQERAKSLGVALVTVVYEDNPIMNEEYTQIMFKGVGCTLARGMLHSALRQIDRIEDEY